VTKVDSRQNRRQIAFDFVAGLLKVDCRRLIQLVDRVSVAKFEHVKLGRFCRKWVIFVAGMSNVLSTLSPVCMGPKRHSRPCQIRLCHQCAPGFGNTDNAETLTLFRFPPLLFKLAVSNKLDHIPQPVS